MEISSFIVRRWQGAVRKKDAKAYLQLMGDVALPDYARTPGNLAAFCLHREDGDVVRVEMLSWWRSLADIRAFAGEDIALAKYYDFDDLYLLKKERYVEHWFASGTRTFESFKAVPHDK